MHVSIILPAAHTNTHTLPAARLESVILVQSNSSFLYGLTIWFMALVLRSDPGYEKRRNHSIITFNGFIPLPQQRCCPGMAPKCCLVSGSACFGRMMERSGRLDSKATRGAGGESTGCFIFSSQIRYLEDGCMISGCEKRVTRRCSHLKQNTRHADTRRSSVILRWRMTEKSR